MSTELGMVFVRGACVVILAHILGLSGWRGFAFVTALMVALATCQVHIKW